MKHNITIEGRNKHEKDRKSKFQDHREEEIINYAAIVKEEE